MFDRDDGVAARGGKTDAQLTIAAAPRMNGDAAAAGAVGIDELADLALNAVVRQGIDDNLPLPGAIGVYVPVLDGAAAAGSKIFAKRRDALGAWLFDAEKLPALGMTVGGRHLDGFAAERIGHVDTGTTGDRDAIAAMADMVDHELFSHGARREKIRCCRRRP